MISVFLLRKQNKTCVCVFVCLFILFFFQDLHQSTAARERVSHSKVMGSSFKGVLPG